MEKLHRSKDAGLGTDFQAKKVSAAALVAAGANGGCGLFMSMPMNCTDAS